MNTVCSICGKKFAKWPTRLWAIACLADPKVAHHSGCRDGCDGCVAKAGDPS